MGTDGGDLSCPGRRVVADSYQESSDSVADGEAGGGTMVRLFLWEWSSKFSRIGTNPGFIKAVNDTLCGSSFSK